MSAKKNLRLLINLAKEAGLNEQDIHHAEEFIKYDEFGLSFDMLITQMYEYDVAINSRMYELIVSIGSQLKLSSDEYDCMKTLIRGD